MMMKFLVTPILFFSFLALAGPGFAAEAIDITAPITYQAAQKDLSPEERTQPLQNYTMQHIVDMAQRGHPEAQMKLGYAYVTGSGGLAVDMVKSFEWSIKAARQGNMKAQYNVALDYGRGQGAQKDRKKSMYWMRKSAAQGFEPAIEYVGVYDKALVHNDPIPIIDAITKEAEAGNAEAAYDLGNVYMHGRGIPKDITIALKWYEKVAGLGHAESQFIMASLTMEGDSNKKKLNGP